MGPLRAKMLIGIIGACCICLLSGTGVRASGKGEKPSSSLAKVTIEYPLEGSIFPPEITPPTVMWRDSSDNAKRWLIEITFASHANPIRLEVPGEHVRMGELDPQAGSGDELTKIVQEQASTRTWKPDTQTWDNIKRSSINSTATITIKGIGEDLSPVSIGIVKISTSSDPVGAPVFYRDVPLILSPPTAKGAIAPLPPYAIPLIKWKMRNIAEPQSKTVMENLPTCANCHSFSRDGKTFGLDVDGPKNDKGLYALTAVAKQMAIRNEDVIRWSAFQENPDERVAEPAVKRFGFMSQVSPDGRFVVTSIGPPALKNLHQKENPDFVAGLSDRLFSTVYPDVRFTQVFYPTRGILAWYGRKEGKLRHLPGADDPKYVHTSAFWSPDGKYLIFSRAEASDPYPPDAPKPEYANDPREPLVKYDLYRIPFNDGKGGKAEPVVGASNNGMSNNFPKVSPDGRWIVFVQNRSGLLMRPNSKLYIVPFQGGKPRLMTCNTSLMNSWHTFSPNGRWLAFSSKARSPYTQLLLTHIDENGNDSPAILVENTTAANRAVNIPEFVNGPQNSIEHIDPQATEFYRLFNKAFDLMESGKVAEAVPVLREAVQRDPEDALAHYALGTALSGVGQEREAVEEYRNACNLEPVHGPWFSHLAVSLASNGSLDEAIVYWRKALELQPSDAGAEADLGTALFEQGQADEGYQHLKKAIEMAPSFDYAYNHLGWELARIGRTEEALGYLQTAISLRPDSVEFRANLGYVMGVRGDTAGAVAAFEKAAELSGRKDWRVLAALSDAYFKSARSADAIRTAREALDLAIQQNDGQAQKKLRGDLRRYGATD